MKKGLFISLALSVLIINMNISLAAGDPALGEEKSKSCATCHGSKGEGILPNNPALGGLKQAYIIKQLQDFKSGARNSPTMKMFVQALSEEDMSHIAAYYVSLK